MKYSRLFLILPLWLLAACSSYETPDSGIDCGRQFIDATYKGNFKRARQLLIQDEEQQALLAEKIEKDFRSRTSNQKETLSNASIVIRNLQQLGDSVVLISYLNAYDNKDRKLRVVKLDGDWKTDLAFSFGTGN